MKRKRKEKERQGTRKRVNAVFSSPACILLLQSEAEPHRGSLHTGTQKGHSFEGLVSMAGVAVVRGALDGPNGGSTLENNTDSPDRRILVNERATTV